jgi:hypothetical protein
MHGFDPIRNATKREYIEEGICLTLFQRKNWHTFHGNAIPGNSRRGRGAQLLSLKLAAIWAIGWHSGLFFVLPERVQ